MGWWRRLKNKPDRERARRVGAVLGGMVLGLLYALGLLSFYLRARYLSGDAPSVIETLVAPTAVVETLEAEPSATLFPTMTPGGSS